MVLKCALTTKTPVQRQSFLVKLQWVSQHVPAVHDFVLPLRRRLSASEWAWGTEEESAFSLAKEALLHDVTLAFPCRGGDFVVEVDVSRSGFGALLWQGACDSRVA